MSENNWVWSISLMFTQNNPKANFVLLGCVQACHEIDIDSKTQSVGNGVVYNA